MDKLHKIESSINIVLLVPRKTKKKQKKKFLLLGIEEVLRITLLQIKSL